MNKLWGYLHTNRGGMICIVPNELRDAINTELDKAFKVTPEAEKGREYFYNELLKYYDENGYIPDFSLTPKK